MAGDVTLSTEAVLELLQSVAAEVITPRFRSLSSAQIDEKKPGDLVTVADHESEELITKALLDAYPRLRVIGLDRDPEALKRSRRRLARHGDRVRFVHTVYHRIPEVLVDLGLSEVGVEEIEAARRVIEVVSVQNLYNVGNRQSEDVVQHCEREGIGFIPWFPVAAGSLARPGGLLDEIARDHRATHAQLALAWLPPGWLTVAAEGLTTEQQLTDWIEVALQHHQAAT